MYQEAYQAAQTKLVTQNKAILDDIESRLNSAARDGLTEIYEVYISHRIKYQITDYLKSKGYQCFEAKMGNTFTISCNFNYKK